MRIIKKKIRRGEVVDVDSLTGMHGASPGVSALGTGDHELKIAIGTDKEIEAAEKAGVHFDAMIVTPVCDDCGEEIKGEIHFGPMNVEDLTKPFIPQWCDRCWKKF